MLAYVRTLGRVRAWVVLNFSADVVEVDADAHVGGLGFPLGWDGDGCQLVLGNYDDAEVSVDAPGPGMETKNKTRLTLRGYEARVYVK